MCAEVLDVGEDPLPRVGNIELTNRCNLKCTYCANRKMTRDRGEMPLDVLNIVMDRLAEAGVLQVNLNTVGETLEYENLDYAIGNAKRRGFFVLISTNGQGLTDRVAKTLLDAECDVLRLSVNAGSAELYEKIHQGGTFDLLVSNVENLIHLRNETGSPLSVRLRAVLPRNTSKAETIRHDVEAFWSDRVDEIEFVMFGNMGGRNGAKPLSGGRRVPCGTIWRGVNVLLDGRVSYCPCDFDAESTVGSLLEQSLEQIWSGDRFLEVRERHRLGNLETLQRCQDCDATRSEWYDRKVLAVSPREAAIMDQYYPAWRQRSLSADHKKD